MKLNLFAPINTTSFGYHSSYTLRYLLEKGWDVRHIPIGGNSPDGVMVPTGHFHYEAPCLKIWHPHDMSSFTGTPRIGSTNFELEDLKPVEIHSLKYPDKVIVPTKWAQEVCDRHNIRTELVPLGYDETIFRPTEMEPSDNTIFGNFGKWEIRKGHDVLIKAFNAAFEKDDEVTLVMMPSNPFLSQEQSRAWTKMYKESKLGEKVQIIGRVHTHKDVFNIMKQIHCGVFPARAEGWNLEALEIMGCAKDLIITNCTGHTEFVSDECKLIEMEEEFETAYDGIFFGGFSRWRKFKQSSFDQLVQHLRDVHEARSTRKANSLLASHALSFTWEKAIDVLEEKIKT
jgi:glycosyltransferase involved in cell wall biosynthesis